MCHHSGNPTDSKQYEKPNFERRVLSTTNLYKNSMMREYAILDWFGNAMTTISVFAKMLLSGFTLPLISSTLLLTRNSMWRRKARYLSLLTPLTTCRFNELKQKDNAPAGQAAQLQYGGVITTLQIQL